MTATLFTEALAGRGLWIGLFPPTDVLPTGLARDLPVTTSEPTHCTLVHLGKKVPDAAVADAIRVASVASAQHLEIAAYTGGVARFHGSEAEGDPIVLLLQHPRIRHLRSMLVELLDDYLGPSPFDYTPHVTLGRRARSESIALEAPQRKLILFSRLGVVCGDARLFFAMRPA